MRTIVIAVSLLLIGLIIWAILYGNFSAAAQFLTQTPWGLVTLVDLYLGFLISSVVIFALEPNKRVALIWVIPIYILGNFITGFWLAYQGWKRLRTIQPKT